MSIHLIVFCKIYIALILFSWYPLLFRLKQVEIASTSDFYHFGTWLLSWVLIWVACTAFALAILKYTESARSEPVLSHLEVRARWVNFYIHSVSKRIFKDCFCYFLWLRLLFVRILVLLIFCFWFKLFFVVLFLLKTEHYKI